MIERSHTRPKNSPIEMPVQMGALKELARRVGAGHLIDIANPTEIEVLFVTQIHHISTTFTGPENELRPLFEFASLCSRLSGRDHILVSVEGREKIDELFRSIPLDLPAGIDTQSFDRDRIVKLSLLLAAGGNHPDLKAKIEQPLQTLLAEIYS